MKPPRPQIEVVKLQGRARRALASQRAEQLVVTAGSTEPVLVVYGPDDASLYCEPKPSAPVAAGAPVPKEPRR